MYYHLTCKNSNCKSKGLHYSSDKIEQKLGRILNELTRYMYDTDNEIIVCNSTKTKEIKDIDNAIEKLKQQEKKLVDLYLSSTLDVETINHKNDVIKKEIDKLIKKKTTLDPDNDFKEYTVELLKKLDYEEDNGDIIFKNNLSFAYLFDSLNRKAQKELINRLISSIEITRDDNYNIEIKNIKFTEEFISKSTKDYIDYLNELLTDNNIGITYKEQINKEKLLELENDEDCGRISKYGILRLHFIAQNKPALYETLFMTNKLTHYLLLVSDSCESLYKILMEDYIKNDERLSEKSKELNPIEWTKLMNNYKNIAEEIVLNEYVFV